MKVSHELVEDILYLGYRYNDYDYMLPHLMDSSDVYRNYFEKAKKAGRYIIMDNSLAELGHAYDFNRLKHWVFKLLPNEFIVPDVWMNSAETLAQAKYWKKYENAMKEELKDVTFVAVVQAESYEEACLTYQSLKELGYKKIAFSYGADWYFDIGSIHEGNSGGTEISNAGINYYKSRGRQVTLDNMVEEGIIEPTDRIHLLGCANPFEFRYYCSDRFNKIIETIDTSNPVMAGLEGKIYDKVKAIDKPLINLNSHFDKETPFHAVEIIKYNIHRFKELNGL